jgi:hypothetical protein
VNRLPYERKRRAAALFVGALVKMLYLDTSEFLTFDRRQASLAAHAGLKVSTP